MQGYDGDINAYPEDYTDCPACGQIIGKDHKLNPPYDRACPKCGREWHTVEEHDRADRWDLAMVEGLLQRLLTEYEEDRTRSPSFVTMELVEAALRALATPDGDKRQSRV